MPPWLWLIAFLASCFSAYSQASGILPLPSDRKLPVLVVGKTALKNVTVTAVFPDRILVKHDGGLAAVAFRDMSPDLRARLGYDPVVETAFAAGNEMRQAMASGVEPSVAKEIYQNKVRRAIDADPQLGLSLLFLSSGTRSIYGDLIIIDGKEYARANVKKTGINHALIISYTPPSQPARTKSVLSADKLPQDFQTHLGLDSLTCEADAAIDSADITRIAAALKMLRSHLSEISANGVNPIVFPVERPCVKVFYDKITVAGQIFHRAFVSRTDKLQLLVAHESGAVVFSSEEVSPSIRKRFALPAVAGSKVSPDGVGASFEQLDTGDLHFSDVIVTAVFPDRIAINHSSGAATIPMENLPEDLQRQFHYDPDKAAQYKETAEEKRPLVARRDDGHQAAPVVARQSAASSPSPAPVSVPSFNGIPLRDILQDAVVAYARAPIYDIQGGDRAYREANDAIVAKYGTPSSSLDSSYQARQERYEAFKALGENSHAGRIIGYVRSGFLVKNVKWKHSDSAPVALPKPLGGIQFGCVRWGDFYAIGYDGTRKWWDDDTRDLLSHIPEKIDSIEPCPLTEKSLLLDPFDAANAILANTEKEMLHAWLISVEGPGGLPLAVVETKDGLFLGCLTEQDSRGLSSLTWEQVVADKSQPYFLKVKATKPLQQGMSIFSLFDGDSRARQKIASSNPQDFIISSDVFPAILQKGSWSLKTNFLIPRDSGFEPVTEVSTQASFQFEIEKKLNRVRLAFDAIDTTTARFLISSEFDRREVARSVAANGRETVEARPWKKQKEILNAELNLAADGAIRFTDGELIYQITKGKLSPELVIYTVEKSNLKQ